MLTNKDESPSQLDLALNLLSLLAECLPAPWGPGLAHVTRAAQLALLLAARGAGPKDPPGPRSA